MATVTSYPFLIVVESQPLEGSAVVVAFSLDGVQEARTRSFRPRRGEMGQRPAAVATSALAQLIPTAELTGTLSEVATPALAVSDGAHPNSRLGRPGRSEGPSLAAPGIRPPLRVALSVGTSRQRDRAAVGVQVVRDRISVRDRRSRSRPWSPPREPRNRPENRSEFRVHFKWCPGSRGDNLRHWNSPEGRPPLPAPGHGVAWVR